MTNIVNQNTNYSSYSSQNTSYMQEMMETMGITPDMVVKTIALTPPLLLADKFINSKIAGDENKSLLKKIAEFGDKISYKINSNGKAGEKFVKFLESNQFTKYFTDKFTAYPRNSLVKPIINPEASTLTELATQISSLKKRKEYSYLFEDGKQSLTDSTKQFLQTLDPKNVAKEKENLIKAADELISKGIDKVPKDGILPGSVKLSFLNNKIKAMEGKFGNTLLGKYFAKASLDLKHNTTFGGGIFGFAFVSYAFNHAYKEASEAPDGEKISTFMHILSEEFLNLVLLQVGTKSLYNIVGNKYRGMTSEARTALEDLIEKTNSNKKITAEELKIAKLQKELLLKGVNKNEVEQLKGKSLQEAENLFEKLKNNGSKIKFWEKPLKSMGRILGMGLDELQPVKFSLFGKDFKPTLKGTFGGIGRFAAVFCLIQPIIQKPLTAIGHAIFGKPETYLAKEEALTNTDEKFDENQNQNQDANSVNRWTNLPESSGLNQPVQTTTETPVENNSIAAAKINNDETNLYVPSVQVDNSYLIAEENEINQRVKNILKNTDSTVERISKTLN